MKVATVMIVAALLYALYMVFTMGSIERAVSNSAAEKAYVEMCRKLAQGSAHDKVVSQRLCD